MFYIVGFSEKHNQYIEYGNNVYLNYFYDNQENCFVGVIVENISQNYGMGDEEVVDLVDTKIFTFLNHVFSCKNINGFSGLTHPNSKLFNKFKGKVNISQLLIASEKNNIFSKIITYTYNMYQKILYDIKNALMGEDIKLIQRVLEVQIKSSEDDQVYLIRIISQDHLNNMVKANVIKKLYKIYNV